MLDSTRCGLHNIMISKIKKSDYFGGLGTMGFGFPAAIGARFGRKKDAVLAICGDGSFQMNMQEFSTAVANNLDLKIVLINNDIMEW